MLNIKRYIPFVLCSLIVQFSIGQETQNDSLDTQVVNVMKPYTPKISDAFKVKEIPELQDETNTVKKEVTYNIFSIPVASTFTPAKGRAAEVDKAEKDVLYDNFLSFGPGTYTSLLGELYLNHEINRTESVGGYVSHHSSQGGIDGVLLDDKFSESGINVNYAKNSNDLSWNVDAGYEHRVFNWYGVPQPEFNENNVQNIDPQHKFFGFAFGGEIEFEDLLINKVQMRFRRFADDYDSGENRFIGSSNFDIPLTDGMMNATVKFDYIKGNFNRSVFDENEINYGNFQIGVIPSYEIIEDDLTVNLGVSAYYLNDTEDSDNKFYIYPKVTASYRLVSDVLITYGGIEGDLIQNNYADFAEENPFVSPTLNVMPTNKQYDAYVGLKGKLSSNMSYNLRGNYTAASDQALFLANPAIQGEDENYLQGNSFGIIYDDIKTFSVFGELKVDVNRNFNLGIKAEYFNYTTDDQEFAWNLPDFRGSLFTDFQISDKWFAGANLYYVGERMDQKHILDPFNPTVPANVVLESFFDANAHLGYHITDRWSVYAKANNIMNQDYQRWTNYQVQGLQLLAGATYKFDF